MERTIRFTLLVFILAAAAFLSAITTVRIAIRGRIVSMPNLVGKSAVQAQQILNRDKLHIRVADRIYDQHPIDTVIRQSPAPGEQIKIQEDAQVIVSLGPEVITLPALEGRSVRLARISVLQSGLQLGEVSVISTSGFEPDIVIKQDPPAGTKAVTPRVDLLIAAAPAPPSYVMPALVGLAQGDADRILTAAGLRVSKRNLIADAGAPKGTVIGQAPPMGERIAPDVAVELGIAD